MIAPYRFVRAGQETIELSAILGQKTLIEHPPLAQLEGQIQHLFGALHEPIAPFIPFTCLCTSRQFSGVAIEALILPESWMIPGSINAPVLNNTTQHRERFYRAVQKNIPLIFEPKTATLLLDALTDDEGGTQTQLVEYLYHEAGHTSGLGIRRKVQENLLSTAWKGGVEEWRTDGVEFELAARTLPRDQAGKLVAANLCLRFGIDAQRSTGGRFEAHSLCSLLMLNCLLRSGACYVKHNQLALQHLNYESLATVVDLHSQEALKLTKTELTTSCITAYESIELGHNTQDIFQRFIVEPCL